MLQSPMQSPTCDSEPTSNQQTNTATARQGEGGSDARDSSLAPQFCAGGKAQWRPDIALPTPAAASAGTPRCHRCQTHASEAVHSSGQHSLGVIAHLLRQHATRHSTAFTATAALLEGAGTDRVGQGQQLLNTPAVRISTGYTTQPLVAGTCANTALIHCCRHSRRIMTCLGDARRALSPVAAAVAQRRNDDKRRSHTCAAALIQRRR